MTQWQPESRVTFGLCGNSWKRYDNLPQPPMDKYERFELEQKQKQDAKPKPAEDTLRFLAGLVLVIRVAVGLIAIALVYGIYRVLRGQFETVVASILIILFAMVAGHVTDSNERFRDIRKLLGDPEAKREQADRSVAVTKATIPLINFGTYLVVDLIALWHLIRAIGWL
jgi:hypothetical protein